MKFNIISGLFIVMTVINTHAYSLSDSELTKQTQYVSNDIYSGIPVMGAWQYATGRGVVIAIIDTGIAEHGDLNLAPGFDMVSYFSEADFENDGDGGRDNDPTDNGDNGQYFQWHGLSVAGVAAANGGLVDGIKGVAYDASILPIRAMGQCSIITVNGKTGQTCFAIGDIIDAIYWATGNRKEDGSKWVMNATFNTHPANVINISLTARGTCDPRLQEAIDFAIGKNITIVAAAGNHQWNESNVEETYAEKFQPASCHNVITVAATGLLQRHLDISNVWGQQVDSINVIYIAAPGRLLHTLSNTGESAPEYDKYTQKTGTSFAAPMFAGTAALLYEINPQATIVDIRNAMMNTTNSLGCPPKYCGSGVLNTEEAVNYMFKKINANDN